MAIDEQKDKTNGTSLFTRIIGILSALVALVGFFYAIGVVFFIFQLWVTFGSNFFTALHAASLISRVVILGQSLRVLLIPTLLFAAITIPLFSVYASPRRIRKMMEQSVENDEIKQQINKRSSWARVTALLSQLVKWLIPTVAFTLVLIPMVMAALEGNWRQFFSLLIQFLVGGCTGAVLIYTAYQGQSWLWRLLNVGITIVVGSLIAAIVEGRLDQPPLPLVEIQNNGQVVQGKLLVHVDGYWYFFAEQNGQLKALSDRGVENVTYP